MATFRMIAVESDGTRHVQEFDDYPAVLQALTGRVPWHDCPLAVTIQQLPAFVPVPWSEVVEGDEVYAPDGSVWLVGGVARNMDPPSYTIVHVLDDREVTTTPRPDAEVRRRPGPIAMVRQMLADAGMTTKIVRETEKR